jgi:2-amino-4-hydroxy-6-hydroxymethyldihydropteridine diphosphokinase
MPNAFLGLGSNLGEREYYLAEARRQLAAHPLIEIIRSSSRYETEPVGYLDQGLFLNQVLEIATALRPRELLLVTQGIENGLGRKRLIHWGPRVIDLDILLYGDSVLDTPELTLPHPRMYERRFVLAPLGEIAAEFVHPDGMTTREHLDALRQRGNTEKIRLFRG